MLCPLLVAGELVAGGSRSAADVAVLVDRAVLDPVARGGHRQHCGRVDDQSGASLVLALAMHCVLVIEGNIILQLYASMRRSQWSCPRLRNRDQHGSPVRDGGL